MADISLEDKLRAIATNGAVKFEVFEHEGVAFAVRQINPKIARSLARYKEDMHGRVVQMAIEVVHSAIPVMGQGGEQMFDEVLEPELKPHFGEDGRPATEPITDARGAPIINIEGKPLMRAVMVPVLDVEGKPVVKVRKVPRYTLGRRLFDDTFFDTLMEQPNNEGSFLFKVGVAAQKVNDRQESVAHAKKS